MTRVSLLLNIFFGAAIAVLFYLQFRGGSGSGKPTIVPPTIALKPSRIVYINTDSLWENYEFVKEIKKTLLSERSSTESELAGRYQALMNEEQSFKEIAGRLSEEEGLKQQQALLAKEQKFAEYREQVQEKLMKKEQEQNERIQRNITSFLESNYRSTPYSYILGYTTGGGILFANDSLDITREVIKGLNDQYKAGKK